jgi:hypothetical protein
MMVTNQPTSSQASTQPTPTTAKDTGQPGHRSASFRNLAFTYLAGVALMVLQSVGYHLYKPTDGSVGQDVPFYFISGLIGCLIAAIGLFRVSRSRKDATAPWVGMVLSALGVVIFPVAYYTPITFIWGVTSYLLSRDARPGRLRTAARVLGIIALCLTPLVVLLRAAGVTYQLGG